MTVVTLAFDLDELKELHTALNERAIGPNIRAVGPAINRRLCERIAEARVTHDRALLPRRHGVTR